MRWYNKSRKPILSWERMSYKDHKSSMEGKLWLCATTVLVTKQKDWWQTTLTLPLTLRVDNWSKEICVKELSTRTEGGGHGNWGICTDGSRCQVMTSEDVEDLTCAAIHSVICTMCRSVKWLLLVVTSWKCSIYPITNQNPVSDH
jgi:hypothetical protein